MENFRAYLEDNDTFKRVILAGFSLQHAESIFVALEMALPEDFPKDTPEYVYLVGEDKFYLRGETEEILPEKIWDKSSDDDDEAETEAFIKKHGLKRLPMEKFTGNLSDAEIKKLASEFLGEDIAAAEKIAPVEPAPKVEEKIPAKEVRAVEMPVKEIPF